MNLSGLSRNRPMKHASLATRAKNSFGKMVFKEYEVVKYFFSRSNDPRLFADRRLSL